MPSRQPGPSPRMRYARVSGELLICAENQQFATHTFAPVPYSHVFRRSALPDATLHLDDPVDAAGLGRLHDNPVR